MSKYKGWFYSRTSEKRVVSFSNQFSIFLKATIKDNYTDYINFLFVRVNLMLAGFSCKKVLNFHFIEVGLTYRFFLSYEYSKNIYSSHGHHFLANCIHIL